MSFTLESGKELAPVTPKSLVLCEIAATDGDTVYLSTTACTYGGNTYLPRIQNQVIEAIQAQSPQGYDIPGSIQLTIVDSDLSLWTGHANAHGWRGGTLTVTLVLLDIPGAAFSTNAYTWTFILGKPNIDAKGIITVEAQSKTSMTRLKVPNVPRQNRDPWVFPATSDQRLAALKDPTSIYYQCGYSPDQTGTGFDGTPPVGNLTGGVPFTSCDYTRQSCTARGMFNTDSSSRATRRFCGDTWIAPVQYSGRQYTSGQKLYGFNTPNPATGATYYPMVYGQQWVDCIVLEPAADPNSFRAECIVCIATDGPAKVGVVLVNGVLVPQNNNDVLFTWRYVTQGGRTGAISQDAIYDGTGDPHGSTCCIEIVVPSQLVSSGVPNVQALLQGPPTLIVYPITSAAGSGGQITITFPGYNAYCAPDNAVTMVGVKGNAFVADGNYAIASASHGAGTITLTATGTGTGAGGYVYFYAWTTNPVWHLMDLLTWGPFFISDFDPTSWFNAAAICDTPISYVDKNGVTQTHARYRSSFALTGDKRQTLAQTVTALRNNAGMLLGKDPVTGLLTCFIEGTLADQQPSAVNGSNYNTPVASVTAAGASANGYLAYLFDGVGSIKKNTLKLNGRSINDTPNRVAFGFQDEDNAWVSDTLSDIDANGYVSSGNQEIDVPLSVLGIPNFDQGTRQANVELAKALYGNSRFDAGGTELPEFETTIKAAHLASRVGYICGLKYDQLGL